MKFFLVAVLLLLISAPSNAQDSIFRSTNLPLPRYVSLSADEVHVRAGPGLQYPILWQFQKENLPVEVTLEFDAWRKIRDHDGEEGWVHVSLLSGARYGLIVGDSGALVRKDPRSDARAIAAFEPRVVARMEECALDWCKVAAQGYAGWVYKNFLWGVYDTEEFH